MKRLLSVALAAVCMLLLIPNATYAFHSELSNLTIVMEYGGATLRGIEVTVCRVSDASLEGGSVTYNATEAFSGAGADFTNLTREKNIALATALHAYACANNIVRRSKITGSDGKATFTGLSAGLYLVAQGDGGNREYAAAPYLVSVSDSVISFPKTEPVKPGAETISVSVYKIWVGTDNPPGGIQVQLYRNGNPHSDPVTLNTRNYWRCAWDNLNSGDAWTVDEINVPEGFVKTVSGNISSGFIITNTRKTQAGVGPPKSPLNPGYPKTDDTSNIQFWILLNAVSCIGLLAVYLMRKKRRSLL